MKTLFISCLAALLAFGNIGDVSASIPKTTKVSDNDTTAGYLNGKLVAGTGISFTENSDGGDETLTIAATTGVNWDSVTSGEIQSAGINWSSLSSDIQAAGINWSSVTGGQMSNTGINWSGVTDFANDYVLTGVTGGTVKFAPAGAGSGDVTSVGDCTDGACVDGTSDGGTLIALYDGNSNKSTFYAGDSTVDLSYVFPTTSGSSGQYLKTDGAGVLSWDSPAGAGDVIGPATNTDSYVPQWNGANSKTLKDGLATDGSGDCSSGAVCLGDHTHSSYLTTEADTVIKAIYDAQTILHATSDNTPVALTVGEQTVVGRVTGGNIAALSIDSDLTSVSANDDTVPSAKAVKAVTDLKDSVTTAGRSLTRNTNDFVADSELYTEFRSITIETPTDSDNFLWFEAPIALTVTRVTGIVESATSAVLTVQECDSAGDNCSTVESVTADIDGTISTSIDNASIDAGDIVRVDVGTVTGTVGQAHLTMTFTKDD